MTKPKHVDPSWPQLLVNIHERVEQMDKLQAARDAAAAEVDKLVAEAVDDGERYQDIAKAAGRSVPWVQTVLRRLDIEGPRVRRITKRAEDARRMDEEEAAERKAKRMAKLTADAEKATNENAADVAELRAAVEANAEKARVRAVAKAANADPEFTEVDDEFAEMMP